MEDILKAKEFLENARYAVFFGGAGVSTDSGIPDFRSSGGVYDADESKEYYLSNACLRNDPEAFFRFYRENMLYPDALPNDTHLALARLEQEGKLQAVITQNIDGLHQKAGSKKVIELHGTTARYYCSRCGKLYDPSCVEGGQDILRCEKCGGIVRPDVTLYGESLSSAFYDGEEEIAKADVLIVGGTSLTVQPAASLVGQFQGDHLIIINRTPTPYDGLADMVIRQGLSEVFRKLAE